MTFLATASGLTMDSVRSIAIKTSPGEKTNGYTSNLFDFSRIRFGLVAQSVAKNPAF
jgi:hypothetical protein